MVFLGEGTAPGGHMPISLSSRSLCLSAGHSPQHGELGGLSGKSRPASCGQGSPTSLGSLAFLCRSSDFHVSLGSRTPAETSLGDVGQHRV